MIFNTFYALKNTTIPTCIALTSIGCNIIGNYYLTPLYQGQGIAVATIASSCIQMIIGLFFLKKSYQINLHYQKLLFFLLRYSIQLIILSIPFGIAYLSIYSIIKFYAPYTLMLFLINKIGYWLWVGPLCGLLGTTIWLSKAYFKIQIFFIE